MLEANSTSSGGNWRSSTAVKAFELLLLAPGVPYSWSCPAGEHDRGRVSQALDGRIGASATRPLAEITSSLHGGIVCRQDQSERAMWRTSVKGFIDSAQKTDHQSRSGRTMGPTGGESTKIELKSAFMGGRQPCCGSGVTSRSHLTHQDGQTARAVIADSSTRAGP